ncbi:MAG TPA: hypothetical protein VFC41_04460 [Anaerovoracaceae bacterium]|nr:hypothetical protein [Anaerovoracaceae bacterium]
MRWLNSTRVLCMWAAINIGEGGGGAGEAMYPRFCLRLGIDNVDGGVPDVCEFGKPYY